MGEAHGYDPVRDEQLAATAVGHLEATLSSENPRTQKSLQIISPGMVARLAVRVSAEELGRHLNPAEVAIVGSRVEKLAEDPRAGGAV